MLAFSPTAEASHFKVTSRAVIGHRPLDHERLTHPFDPIRRRQRASWDGFEIGGTLGEAKLGISNEMSRWPFLASCRMLPNSSAVMITYTCIL
jgi:hypothetical protein